MKWYPLFISLVLGQLEVEHYDYVVVGAGPTGSMTAMGLAEQGYNTLLIDAGQDHINPNITTPGLHVRSSEDPAIAWDFHVKHYEESTGLRQKVLYPRVAGLGGCTLHNAMIHILPNKQDFDKMVATTGDSSWSESNMRRYYNKITRPSRLDRNPMMRMMDKMGTTIQRISSSMTSMLTDKDEAWLKLSTVNLGNLLSVDMQLMDVATSFYPKAMIKDMLGFDINAESIDGKSPLEQEASFLVPMNADVNNGLKRHGIYEKLMAFPKKSKLTIWTNTLATKILLDNQNRAYGIEYLKGEFLYKAGKRVNPSKSGKPGKVHVNREVIISAGTFNTPQLMMLSGIGDPNHLREVGIKPRVNLPGVGRNLHDRYETAINVEFENDFKLTEPCLFRGDTTDPCYKQFAESGTGPYSFNGVLTGTTIKSSPTLTNPDLFLLTSAALFSGYHEGMGDELVANKNIITLLVLKAHTHNHEGTVKLMTNDPTDVPDINFKYFSQGADKDLTPIIKGLRDARAYIKSLNLPHKELTPGPDVQSDKQLADFIINTAWGHHATGTMKMGQLGSDPLVVLDGQFRVRGVKNLRVADMSIFPDIPGYFPVLYLYMVGSKAADVIGTTYTQY